MWADCARDINTRYCRAVPACPSVQCSCCFALPCFRIDCSPPTRRLSPPPIAGAFRHGLRAQGCTLSSRCTLYTLLCLALPVRPGRAGRWSSESTACVKWSAIGLGSLGLPPIELHADCRLLHTDVHCFATGLGSLGLPPNELHVVCKTMYTTAATEAHSLPVPCHDGSTVLAVHGHQGELCVQGGVFDSFVVLSAVSGSVGGGVGWSGPLWSCMGCDMGSSGGSVGCACGVS